MRFTLTLLLLLIAYTGSALPANKDTVLIRIDAIPNSYDRANAYNKAAENAWQNGQYAETITYAERGLKLCTTKEFNVVKAQLLNNKGIANDYLGNYTTSLKIYYKALRIAENENAAEIEADIYGNIGIIYTNQNRLAKAYFFHSKALKIRRQIHDEHGISASLNNLAIILVERKQFDAAIKNYTECIEIDLKRKDERGLGDDYNNVGVCYLEMKEYSAALDYFEKALKVRESMNNQLGVAETISNIGTLYYDQKQYAKAKPYFLQSVQFAKQIGSKESMRYSYQHLYKVEEKGFKDSVAAYKFYKLYILYSDSIENSKSARLETEYELKYKFDKEREVAKLLQEQKESRFRTIIYAISFGFLLILIFSTLLYKRWKETQYQRSVIEEKNKLLEQKNREITDSITYAKRIQTAILPSTQEITKIIPDHFVLYLPKDIVSGDFYWIEENSDYAFIAVADCTGHGVPGALMSVVCHNALNRSIREFGCITPSTILEQTRSIIIDEISKVGQQISDGMDISLCVHKKGTNHITWAGANNPLLMHRSGSDELVEFRPTKQSIGFNQKNVPFTEHVIPFERQDKIYLFSDGYADQFGGELGKKFMTKKLRQLIHDTSNMQFESQKNHLENTFHQWKGNLEQVDDVCIICFSIT